MEMKVHTSATGVNHLRRNRGLGELDWVRWVK